MLLEYYIFPLINRGSKRNLTTNVQKSADIRQNELLSWDNACGSNVTGVHYTVVITETDWYKFNRISNRKLGNDRHEP